MRRLLRMAAGMVALASLVGLSRGAPLPTELVEDPLVGTWTVRSFLVNGRELFLLPEEEKPVFVIKDGTAKMQSPKGDRVWQSYKYKLDQSSKPATIDLELIEARSKAKGIYTVKNQEAKICWTNSNPERPKEFASNRGSGTTLITLKKRDTP